MTKTSFKWNHTSHFIVIKCSWTQMGEAMTYDFKYTGDLLDAIHHCYKNVLGASYPDFKIELKEHRRT